MSAVLHRLASLAACLGCLWLSRRIIDARIALGPREPHAVPFKVCGCGCSYSLAGWRCLPMAGRWLGLELRHCMCGSTIAVEDKA